MRILTGLILAAVITGGAGQGVAVDSDDISARSPSAMAAREIDRISPGDG